METPDVASQVQDGQAMLVPHTNVEIRVVLSVLQ